jgi:hypothetical protein
MYGTDFFLQMRENFLFLILGDIFQVFLGEGEVLVN